MRGNKRNPDRGYVRNYGSLHSNPRLIRNAFTAILATSCWVGGSKRSLKRRWTHFLTISFERRSGYTGQAIADLLRRSMRANATLRRNFALGVGAFCKGLCMTNTARFLGE